MTCPRSQHQRQRWFNPRLSAPGGEHLPELGGSKQFLQPAQPPNCVPFYFFQTSGIFVHDIIFLCLLFTPDLPCSLPAHKSP